MVKERKNQKHEHLTVIQIQVCVTSFSGVTQDIILLILDFWHVLIILGTFLYGSKLWLCGLPITQTLFS